VLTPTLLTAALLSTSVAMHVASRAASAARRQTAWRSLAVAFTVQVVYLVWQLHDYVHAIHVYRPQASAWASVYVTLLAPITHTCSSACCSTPGSCCVSGRG